MAEQPSHDELKTMVKKGQAMPAPGQDRPGRFPIRNEQELRNAIAAVGRAGGGEAGRKIVRRFILKRARQLSLTRLIPDSWNPDGSLSSGP